MRKVLKSISLTVLTFLVGLNIFAQTVEGNDVELDYSSNGRGWTFGLNVGVYYPSKRTAAFYNGSSSNVNNADFIMALIIEFNYMKLKANDVIIFEVDPIASVSTLPDYRLYPMRGVEERIYGNIGLKRTIPKTDKYSFFVTGGLNVNSTKVKQCSFYVEDVEYDMVNQYGDNPYVPNSNMQTFPQYQGGIGVGMFAGAGAALTFGNGIVIEPGITVHWLMVKLDNYKNMNPGAGAYVRFMF
jgi:hypothetical protein